MGTGPDVEDQEIELTVLMPCLNESETLATCIGKTQRYLCESGVVGEVLIADNGSTDGSQDIARDLGARVVDVRERGYGAALLDGIASARGRFIIMADADDSYDFLGLAPFVERLRAGDELVMGNRFRGGIEKGAMPPLHRYLGNPVLSGLGRLFFGTPVGDFHCGLRGFSKAAIDRLGLRTTGMEFASEMVVKATLNDLRISEVPTTLSPDGRSRKPHLRSWRDGWRHLRLLLVYSPRSLFLFPGLFLLLGGLAGCALLLPGPLTVAGVTFDIHTLLFASAAVVVGLQTIAFSLFSNVYGWQVGLLPQAGWVHGFLRAFTLERGVVIGLVLILLGLGGSVLAFRHWQGKPLDAVEVGAMMRLVIPSLTVIVSGFQVMFGAFFLSILMLKHR